MGELRHATTDQTKSQTNKKIRFRFLLQCSLDRVKLDTETEFAMARLQVSKQLRGIERFGVATSEGTALDQDALAKLAGVGELHAEHLRLDTIYPPPVVQRGNAATTTSGTAGATTEAAVETPFSSMPPAPLLPGSLHRTTEVNDHVVHTLGEITSNLL